jgi:hypothetical protein
MTGEMGEMSGENLEILGVSEDFLWMKIVFWLASGCISAICWYFTCAEMIFQ